MKSEEYKAIGLPSDKEEESYDKGFHDAVDKVCGWLDENQACIISKTGVWFAFSFFEKGLRKAMEEVIDMTPLAQKAAQAYVRSRCDNCPLFHNCKPLGDPGSIGFKIARLCSGKFREGYRKGYNQRKREEKK